MNLTLLRHTYSPERTLGSLYVDAAFECFTLEDADRLRFGYDKIPGGTAIPAGTYDVVLSFSPKFGQQMPLVLGVPEFSGIRIHPGNWEKDTDGCPLTGLRLTETMIQHSSAAYKRLLAKIRDGERTGGVALEIASARVPDAVEERCREQWQRERQST